MPEPKLQKDETTATLDRPEDAGCEAAEPLPLTAYRLKPVTLKIVPASIDRDWMDWHQNGANRCLPLRVANQAGWFILNDCDLEATWTGKPRIDSLKVKYAKGRESKFIRNIFGHGILTWHIPYLFRTPPGYNLLVRGPTNWIKDGACPLDGLVETDWAVATFTMNWKITRPFLKVKFRAGEPICMIVPQRRGEAEAFQPEVRNIESAPELQQSHRKWAESRRRLIAEKKVLAGEGKLDGKGVVAPLAAGLLPRLGARRRNGARASGESANTAVRGDRARSACGDGQQRGNLRSLRRAGTGTVVLAAAQRLMAARLDWPPNARRQRFPL